MGRVTVPCDENLPVEVIAKIWHLLPHDPAAIARLARAIPASPVVAQLLLNRGVSESDVARSFLNAPLTGLHQPQLLPGVEEAAERLHNAVRQGRHICVYGDYDVDGVTGTVILWQLLRQLGAKVDFHVPERLGDGYGVHADALEQIARNGATLVVTVDCGIANVAEAEEARRLGLELIVTDHHEFKDDLPAAAVLVHPRLPGSGYPFGGLCGSGVAFKLAWALCQRVSGSTKVAEPFREFLLNGVALAALGTVADCVPLHDENRIFVRHGLHRLRQAPSPGLNALLASCGLAEKAVLCANDVAYYLAPRLNAASRLGCARLLVELLTTASAEHATTLAAFLEEQNHKRQLLERRIHAEARDLVAACDLAQTPALVLDSNEWHTGVIGIVASRLVDQFARPVLLIAPGPRGLETGILQGSGRSVPGFPLHEALEACGEYLLSHGGHMAAAGFKVRAEAIPAFRKSFCEYAARHFNSQLPAPRLVLDAEIPLSALTLGLMKEVDRLEPYGMANLRPLFLAGDLEIVGTPRKVGKGERHLSFQVRQQGAAMKAIAFSMADRLDELMSAEGRCCLAFTPRVNEWQGLRKVELEVADFQAGPKARLA
jgi:single-stranded-DNA-specific exonuclease